MSDIVIHNFGRYFFLAFEVTSPLLYLILDYSEPQMLALILLFFLYCLFDTIPSVQNHIFFVFPVKKQVII